MDIIQVMEPTPEQEKIALAIRKIYEEVGLVFSTPPDLNVVPGRTGARGEQVILGLYDGLPHTLLTKDGEMTIAGAHSPLTEPQKVAVRSAMNETFNLEPIKKTADRENERFRISFKNQP